MRIDLVFHFSKALGTRLLVFICECSSRDANDGSISRAVGFGRIK